MTSMCLILMVLVSVPVMSVVCVNNDIIRRAQEDEGNESTNGSPTTNARGPYYSRFTALVSHVSPAQPGPYGWTQNPFAAATEAQSDATSPSLASEVQTPHVAAPPNTSTLSDAGNVNQTDSLPLDFPTGDRTANWGTFVEDHHAA